MITIENLIIHETNSTSDKPNASILCKGSALE